MLCSLKLFAITISSSFLLICSLCFGSQNLNDKHNLNLGFSSTAPLPTGFIIGMSLIIGFMSGGTTAAIIAPKRK